MPTGRQDVLVGVGSWSESSVRAGGRDHVDGEAVRKRKKFFDSQAQIFQTQVPFFLGNDPATAPSAASKALGYSNV